MLLLPLLVVPPRLAHLLLCCVWLTTMATLATFLWTIKTRLLVSWYVCALRFLSFMLSLIVHLATHKVEQQRQVQLEDLERRLKQRQEEREARHDAEMEQLSEALDDDDRDDVEDFEKRFENHASELTRQLEDLYNDRRRDAISRGADEAELDRLRLDHEKEMKLLKDTLQDEHERQRSCVFAFRILILSPYCLRTQPQTRQRPSRIA